MSNIKYAIDVFTNRNVTGWIFNPESPNSELIISVKLYDRVIGKVKANLYREDLLRAGLGNGEHAFQFKYQNKLTSEELANVKFECNSLLLSSETQNALQQYLNMPSVYIDISDVLEFFRHEKKVTGIQRLVSQLLSSLVNRNNLNNYEFIALVDNIDQNFYEIQKEEIEELLICLHSNESQQNYINLIDRFFKEKTLLKSKNNSILLTVGLPINFTNHTAAVKKIVKNKKMSYGTIIYDLIPYHLRDSLPPELCQRFSIWLAEIVNISDFIICISDYTKNQLKEFVSFHSHNERLTISTIPLGSNDQINKITSNINDRYLLEDDYCIYVSTIEERKNHLALLSVWDRLGRSNGNIPQLIIVGKLGWGSSTVLDRIQSNEYLHSKVLVITDASEIDLNYLYKNSLFTIYPSLYEGWGLPVTESLFYGKLCLCSNSTSVPEAGGKYCKYFDPNDEQSMFRVLSNFLCDKSKITKAENRIKKYYKHRSWDDYASDFDSYLFNVPTDNIDFLKKNTELTLGVLYYFTKQPRPNEVFNNFVVNRVTAYQTITGGHWYPPEDTGRWLLGNYGSLSFSIPDTCEVKVRIYLQFYVVPHQYISLSINHNLKLIEKIEYEGELINGLKTICFDLFTDNFGTVSLNLKRHRVVLSPIIDDVNNYFLRMVSLSVAVTADQKINIFEKIAY